MRLRSMLAAMGTASTLAACAALNSPMPPAPVESSPVSQPPAVKTESKPAAPLTVGANQYLVQKGDTLYNIGRKFGIPFSKLAEFNQLKAPYEIHVGQVLNLSAKASTKVADATEGSEDAEVVTSAITRPGSGPVVATNESAATPATAAAESGKTAATATDLEAIADTDIQWQWPLPGKVSTAFDAQTNKGLNITGTPGQAINAAGAGKVIYSGMDVRGYGKLVIIKHNNNLLSVYAHQGNSVVKEGAFVNSGEKLATLPAAGNNKSPILHFEIRQKGKPVDPGSYLPATVPTTNSNNT